ncbi:Histone H1.3 [Sciurus carolinensis]|uniref:Histone H1.3 n=1 Tax=Sciurus carolinensis TaxID=30640 RepID=A0AA41SQ57_SCICA|nr:Histone H1.3 [Sciurus carolinensis]
MLNNHMYFFIYLYLKCFWTSESQALSISKTAPATPGTTPLAEKTPVKKKAAKKSAGACRKASGPPVSELITKVVTASKEHSRVSLAMLKKALVAPGYDMEKNKSRIKLGLKSLVSKGTMVQTKGTGTLGSFKLNKKLASGEAKPKTEKAGTAKAEKPAGAAKKPKKATSTATLKKATKKSLKKARKQAVATKSRRWPSTPRRPRGPNPRRLRVHPRP